MQAHEPGVGDHSFERFRLSIETILLLLYDCAQPVRVQALLCCLSRLRTAYLLACVSARATSECNGSQQHEGDHYALHKAQRGATRLVGSG